MRSTVSPHTYPIKFQFILSLVLTAIALAGGVSCDSEQKRIEHSALALCDSLDKLAESADAEIGVATWEALRDNALDSLARAAMLPARPGARTVTVSKKASVSTW